MKKRRFTKGVDKDLGLGLKGLKISLGCLVVITVFLVVFLVVNQNSFSKLVSLIFNKPGTSDYLAIFAGSLLFIVVPFALAIRLGDNVKARKKKKKKKKKN